MKKDIETDLISVIVPIFNVEAYLRPCASKAYWHQLIQPCKSY